MHGYRQSPDAGDFTVSVEWDLDLLWVTVRDHGCGMRPRMDSPGAGLGLPLIANVTDSFSVTALEEGGTEVVHDLPAASAHRGVTAPATTERPCPECHAPVPVVPGYPDWCDECGWNLQPPPALHETRGGRFDADRPGGGPWLRRPDGRRPARHA